jgi:hypothetical protein
MMTRWQVGEIRRRAATQDERRIGILVLTAAAMASFGAIIRPAPVLIGCG